MEARYTFEDAREIERVYHSILPKEDNRAARAVRSAFRIALRLCKVQFVDIDERRVHALRVYAPDGNDFPQEEIDAYLAGQNN